MDNRTIAAISTPKGVGGIAVIRMSGSNSCAITDKIFKGSLPISQAPTHTVHYGHILDKDGAIVDEVLVTVMRAPKSYTKEDVVEISTHGGLIASKAVLKCIIEAGADYAEPGEFTKRAFLNGRIDLSQAEAIIDIINSKTSLEQKNALSQVSGSLSNEINSVRGDLINLAASMQVIIDYPDEELEDVTCDDILDRVSKNLKKINTLLGSAENGKIIKNGIKTVIAGKPNVGKSSLLNFLARDDRAIVTEIAGTTRDVIEESVSIDGIPLILTDTAGIRQTDDIVEKIGVERSKQSIESADLVIIVFDASTETAEDELTLLEETKNKKRIILINKSDIKNEKFITALNNIPEIHPIELSVKTGEGVDKLISEIKNMYNLGEVGQNDSCIVTNIRHIGALTKAKESLERAIESLNNSMPSDIASIDINMAIDNLGEITGAVISDDIVSAIFHDFCVGK